MQLMRIIRQGLRLSRRPARTWRREDQEGSVLLEVALPPRRQLSFDARRHRGGVTIGMDPNKRSATIAIIDDGLACLWKSGPGSCKEAR
jgi:hypothetical protein